MFILAIRMRVEDMENQRDDLMEVQKIGEKHL